MVNVGPGILHPLLAARWSPTSFDAASTARVAEVESLLEAARWAPSAGNSQPWAFIVARRGEPDHHRLVRHLARSSRAWAPDAELLVANLSHRLIEATDWEYSEFAVYDLGQAVAHMTFQAQSLGMAVRQFRAFNREGVADEFEVSPHWEVTTMSAIGRARQPLPPGLSVSMPSRERRPSNTLHWPRADQVQR